MANESSALDVVRDLIRLPSVIFDERKAAEYVCDFLASQGFRVERDSRNSIMAELRYSDSGPTLLFCGHHDTVPVGDIDNWSIDPFEGTVKAGKLYGRGAVDDKGGLGASLAAIKNVVQAGVELRGRLVFTSVREETSDPSNRGIIHLVQAGLSADCAVVTEPTSLDVCLGHRGRVEVEVVTKGRTAHSSMPEKGVNAIVHMAEVAREISLMRLPNVPPLGSGSQNIGTIVGGLQSNVVPDLCTLRIDRRIVEGETAETVLHEIRGAIETVRRREPNLRADCTVLNAFLPSVMADTHPWVKLVQSTVEEIRQQDVKLYYMQAHTDQEWLVNDAGIPTVIFAPGDMALAHTPDEHVPVSELALAQEAYQALIAIVLAPSEVANNGNG